MKDEESSIGLLCTGNICAEEERNENCCLARGSKLEHGIVVGDWNWKVGRGQVLKPFV